MKQGSLGCLLALVLFALVVSLALNLLQFSSGTGGGQGMAAMGSASKKKTKYTEVVQETGAADQKVVQIDLDGVISSVGVEGLLGAALSSVESIKSQIEQAEADDRVKAVVLKINSPGGEVTASDTLYQAVKGLAKKKPVVVAMSSLGASGAYYLACAADWIVANPTTFTGSIGVIIQSLNYEGLFDKVGLDAVVFKSGKFKDMLSGSRPLTPEESAYVEGMVKQVYERFLGIVASSRALEADQLRDTLADGRILTGKDAKEAGLVDQLGYLEDAFDKARALAEAPDAGVIRYQSGLNFQRLLRLLGAGMESKVEVQLTPGPSFRMQPGRAYLLPEFYAW